jgi:radical SAM/Cys-rich protein
VTVEPFAVLLERRGLSLARDRTDALQINTGFLCNLSCRHCHLEAGPGRTEVMTRETMEEIIGFARRNSFRTIDITGGAPELAPDLPFLIEGLAPLSPRVLLRTNLSALASERGEFLLGLCVARRIALIASFPSTNPAQTDSQRGRGAAEAGVAMLKRLNAIGYGMDGTGLELDLVSNPAGAFLPASQAQAESKFRQDLLRKWGISFHRLYTFANVPLGRFRKWLLDSGNHEGYMRKLVDGFNSCTMDGLMCRTMLSVSWDGCLYDCDFHLAAGRYFAGRRTHVSEVHEIPPPGTPIATGEYCYACTAGSGFT